MDIFFKSLVRVNENIADLISSRFHDQVSVELVLRFAGHFNLLQSRSSAKSECINYIDYAFHWQDNMPRLINIDVVSENSYCPLRLIREWRYSHL